MLDAHSRRIVGWSIDSHQATALVTNALQMAINNRTAPGTVIHCDHGTQFTSWAFSERVRQAGLVPSMGTVGDAFDNALIEAFWARLQTELLDRKRWKTRIELSTALSTTSRSSTTATAATARSGCWHRLNLKRSTNKPNKPPDSHEPSPQNRGQTGWTRSTGSPQNRIPRCAQFMRDSGRTWSRGQQVHL